MGLLSFIEKHLPADNEALSLLQAFDEYYMQHFEDVNDCMAKLERAKEEIATTEQEF